MRREFLFIAKTLECGFTRHFLNNLVIKEIAILWNAASCSLPSQMYILPPSSGWRCLSVSTKLHDATFRKTAVFILVSVLFI